MLKKPRRNKNTSSKTGCYLRSTLEFGTLASCPIPASIDRSATDRRVSKTCFPLILGSMPHTSVLIFRCESAATHRRAISSAAVMRSDRLHCVPVLDVGIHTYMSSVQRLAKNQKPLPL